MPLDVSHIIEIMIGNIFVAGVTYGTIKSKLASLDRRMDEADKSRDHMVSRIDDIFTIISKR